MIRYVSVCSGIEAATVAWHPLGWRPLLFAEIAKFPAAVLAHRFPEVPNAGDFTTIAARTDCDLLAGGTPCQAFSVTGHRGGLSDARGNLALEFVRLADRLRPRWVFWENVPGVLSSGRGRDFGSLLGALGQLGYGWAFRVLDAQFFGVPQRRRRVFVVGHLGDWRRAAAVLFERDSLRRDTPTRRGAGEKATEDASRGPRGVIPFDTTQVTHPENRSRPEPGDPCHPLTAGGHPPAIATPDGVRRLTPRECERLQGFPDDYTLVPGASDSSRYKALGNSMAVPVVRWIGDRIDFVDRISGA